MPSRRVSALVQPLSPVRAPHVGAGSDPPVSEAPGPGFVPGEFTGGNVADCGHQGFGPGQNGKRTVIAGMGRHPAVQPRHRVKVVVHDIGPGCEHPLEYVMPPTQAGDQDLDGLSWEPPAQLLTVRANWPAPPSGRSPRVTEVMTTWWRPRQAARAPSPGMSRGCGHGHGLRTPAGKDQRRLFQQLHHGLEEGRPRRTINYPVVDGQAERHS